MEGAPLILSSCVDSVPAPLKAVSCCGTSLGSKTSHRYVRQKWRKRLLITIDVDEDPLQSLHEQPREEKKGSFEKYSCCLLSKEIILHVCVSIHLNKRGGKSFQKLRGSQGGTGRET